MQNSLLNLPCATPVPSISLSLPGQLLSSILSSEDTFSFSRACSRDLETLTGSSCLGSSELGNSSSKGQVGFSVVEVSLPLLREEQGRTHTAVTQQGKAVKLSLSHLGLSRSIFSADFGPWTMSSFTGFSFGSSEVFSWLEGSGGFSLL